MSKYIDAEKLEDVVTGFNSKGWGITRNDFKLLDRVLFEFPAADVVEVRHGRWEKKIVPTDFDGEVFNVEHIVCSLCESAIPLNKTYKRDWYSDYCPSCGSRMDLESDDE